MGNVAGCLAGTRKEIIGKIVEWIDGSSNQPMCWLNGAAGSGKSAISRTIAKLCEESNRLGASFFFFRGAGRRSTITHFISTLAYHLAFSVPATKPYIENALKRDTHIVYRSLERQFRQLIIDPVRSVTGPLPPMVITIDALDECDDRGAMADFIDIVTYAFQDHQLPLRFFFTSRVEEHIQKKFMVSPALAATCRLALQDFSADVDLRTFFRSRFSTIYEENRRLMRNIALPWPSESDLDELVERSAGSFIFAFTLVNFVNDGSDLPDRKLQVGLESHAGLDPLYTQVLNMALPSPHFDRVFGTIMLVTKPMSVVDLGFLLQINARDVIHALQGVQSILIVPEDDVQPVRLFHTSLRDFLTTKSRSKNLFVNHPTRCLLLVGDCLGAMRLHSGDDFMGVDGLKYASQNWLHHLLFAIEEEGGSNVLNTQHGAFMMDELKGFVSQSFDSWINSIILDVQMSKTLDTLDLLLQKLKVSASYQVVCDVERMLQTFFSSFRNYRVTHHI